MGERFRRFLSGARLQLSILGIVALMFAVFIIINPTTFLSFNIYKAFMSIIPFAAILSISLTIIIILGEIDLSFPSVFGICVFTYATVFKLSGNVYAAFISSLAVGAIAGLINGIFVIKIGIPSLIITLGMGFFWRGLVYVLSKGIGISLVGTKGSILYKILVGRIGGAIPAQAVWLVIIVIFFGVLLNYHRFGTHILFTGDNKESAKMMGINIDKVKMIAFMQVGIMAAVAGILASTEVVYVYPTAGDGYLLRVLAAIFLGGTSVFGGRGTIFGSLMGAIIMGTLEAGLISSGVAGFWVQLVYGVVIILSLTIYAYLGKMHLSKK